jgi:predicted nucleic acid-binding protein
VNSCCPFVAAPGNVAGSSCRDNGLSARLQNRFLQSHSGVIASLEQVAAAYNVLPMDAAAFRAWARLMHRKSDTLYEDALIAATAQVHGLQVATRNVADFEALGVTVFNPFAATT